MKDQLKYFIVFVTIVMFSCSNGADLVPEGVLEKDKMIEVMVEIETAVVDALAAPHPDPATDLMSDVYCSY